MAKIVDILATERDRHTSDAFNVVHMYRTGQFYTAYDWSAWIISVISYTDEVRNQTRDRHPLTVTRIKMATSDTTFCKVGFPFKSIEKFCPLRQDFEGVENDHITFRIPLPEPTDNTGITYDRLREAVDKWTDTYEIKPPKRTQEETKQIKAERKADKTANDTEALTPEQTSDPVEQPANRQGVGLIQQILAYPLADSTPMENIAFIQRLKQQITAIF
jgi:hypothetical protein